MRARCADRSVESVSSWFTSAGLSAAIMIVLALPPSAFWRSIVSTESRYGTRIFFFFGSLFAASAEITLPSEERDWLIALPSFSRSPVAPVPDCRSEPARSIRLMMAV